MTLEEWKSFSITRDLIKYLNEKVQEGQADWLFGNASDKSQAYCCAMYDVVALIKEGGFLENSENIENEFTNIGIQGTN